MPLAEARSTLRSRLAGFPAWSIMTQRMHSCMPIANTILLWLDPLSTGIAFLIPAMDQPHSIASIVVASASPAG